MRSNRSEHKCTLNAIFICIGGKKAVEVHAAVWVPDGDAPICMHCKETQFTLINRRHHCRKCGAVVCGPCSNKRFVLPNQSTKPLRVCTHCYDLLSSGAQEPSRRYDSSPDDNSDDEDEKSKNNSHDEVSSVKFVGYCLVAIYRI